MTKRPGAVAREGAEEAAEQSAKWLALPAFRESAEASTKTLSSPNAADATAEFVWRHKGAITVGTAATVRHRARRQLNDAQGEVFDSGAGRGDNLRLHESPGLTSP